MHPCIGIDLSAASICALLLSSCASAQVLNAAAVASGRRFVAIKFDFRADGPEKYFALEVHGIKSTYCLTATRARNRLEPTYRDMGLSSVPHAGAPVGVSITPKLIECERPPAPKPDPSKAKPGPKYLNLHKTRAVRLHNAAMRRGEKLAAGGAGIVKPGWYDDLVGRKLAEAYDPDLGSIAFWLAARVKPGREFVIFASESGAWEWGRVLDPMTAPERSVHSCDGLYRGDANMLAIERAFIPNGFRTVERQAAGWWSVLGKAAARKPFATFLSVTRSASTAIRKLAPCVSGRFAPGFGPSDTFTIDPRTTTLVQCGDPECGKWRFVEKKMANREGWLGGSPFRCHHLDAQRCSDTEDKRVWDWDPADGPGAKRQRLQ